MMEDQNGKRQNLIRFRYWFKTWHSSCTIFTYITKLVNLLICLQNFAESKNHQSQFGRFYDFRNDQYQHQFKINIESYLFLGFWVILQNLTAYLKRRNYVCRRRHVNCVWLTLKEPRPFYHFDAAKKNF